MFLIFLSWIYILFTTINFGVATDKILALKNKNFVVTSFVGLFSVTVLASFWAFFGRINIEFHLFLLVLNFLIYFKLKNEISCIYKTFLNWFKQLSLGLKIYLSFITLLIIAQCSTLPYVIDNESYYIQTIKWLNEYGFVKGLINLHLFFGQTSGWHIAQSVFNFSFLYDNFNDLSGYCLVLGVVFSIEKLKKYYENNNLLYLLIGVFALSSIYFFQFISAPSPDIAVYVLSFIILFYFIENFNKSSIEIFNLIMILILFLLYIKITTFIFILIPIYLLIKNFKIISLNALKPLVLSLLILGLFFAKNIIICGSLLFPFKQFSVFNMNYAITNSVESAIFSEMKYNSYYLNGKELLNLPWYEIFLHWLKLPKLNGIFNKLSVILILISPLFILKFQNKRQYWIVYGLMTLQMIILLATSPQYRFFMNFMLFFGMFCFVCLVRNKFLITSLLFLALIPSTILLFIPAQLSRFTNNKFMSDTTTFPLSAIVFPLSNSKMKTDFEVIELGNFKYNSPIENDFFYGTGNGDLPCVNKTQIKYYEEKFNIIPQMRTKDLKDGFYSNKVNANE